MNYLYFLYVEFLSKYGIPQVWGDISFYILIACIIFAFLLIAILALVLFERKLLGWFTQRKGPNRVGKWGLLQTLADAFKLLCKENITPKNADRILFNLAPIIMFIPTLILLGLIPFCAEFEFMQFQTNLLIFVVLATMPILSIIIASWGSNNKYSLIGGMRNVAQVLAYELPIAFVILSIIVLASSINLAQITLSQSGKFGLLHWFIIPCIIGFFIMLICILAELNRSPFDLPEAESELVCGYNTEYSGMRFALFYLSEYSMLISNSILISILFLGGYLSPFGRYLSSIINFGSLGGVLIYIEQVIWLMLKTFLVLFLIIWIRASFPRMASFDLLKFSWTILLPLSILNFFLMVILKIGGLYA
jgi:NADH-quinone oxidoreductase subunit H